MIPMAPGWWKPSSAAGEWGYSGAIISLCCYAQSSPATSTFNKDGDAGQGNGIYYGTHYPGLVYAFTRNNPTDNDFRDVSYDRTVPFTYNGTTTFIRSEAYENDISADYASQIWQLLDAGGNNVYKFEVVGRTANFGVDCFYTIGAGARTAVGATGSFPALGMKFTFNDTQIIGTDEYGGSNHINGFTHSVTMTDAVTLKASGGRAYMSHSGINIYLVYSRLSYFPRG